MPGTASIDTKRLSRDGVVWHGLGPVARGVGVEKRRNDPRPHRPSPVDLASYGCGLLTPYLAVPGGVSMNETADAKAVPLFLASAARGRAALLIQGDAGMGKTTAWLTALEAARSAGFRVLAARASRDERGFALGIAADLIGGVEPELLGSLPEMQRVAVEKRLLQADGGGSVDDERAIYAAFTTIVNRLSEVSPVIIAVDDVQWLDAPSRDLIAFAARRLTGRVGLLLTERMTTDGASTWLKMETPEGLARLRVRPMNASELQRLITTRVGKRFPRPTMTRIAEVSGGNPFYALELAQALSSPAASSSGLPPALAEITRRRIGHFDDDVQQALLAAACVGNPTVDVMAVITSVSVDQLVQLLEEPETQGIVTIEGNRVRFTEPLLAYGVYSQAPPASRRRMHRALASVEATSEQRARHMALAVASTDPETLLALDVAAADASAEGSPAVAADLLELAIGLGGGTPSRRLRAARHHLRAGDVERSRALAESVADVLPAGTQRADARMLIGGVHLYRGSLDEAAETFRRATSDTRDDRALVRAHLYSALTESLLGNGDAARRHCLHAMTRAEQSKDSHLISQSLATHVALQCHRGLGLDADTLDRALQLEDRGVDTPAPFSPRTVHALSLAWMGRFSEAEPKLADLLGDCAARGSEVDLPWLQFHAAMLDVAMGRYAHADRHAEDMLSHADQIGGVCVRVSATIPRALAAVYTGREQDARREIAAAASPVCEGQWSTPWPTMALGFLEVSLGNHAEALKVLQPLLSQWQRVVGTDVTCYYFIPDAVEALIAMNALDRAEELTEALEHGGARLNHPWMTAVGARCRSLVLSARGDLDAAERAASRAMDAHDELSAPFERARTQLVLGQLQRRTRHRLAARLTLEESTSTFEALGTPIWAARARAELMRMTAVRDRESELTPSEQRVAELVAAGMTNKDVAAALFISPKTVESNLSRVYRKLGIRTRVELGRRLNRDAGPSQGGTV